MPPQDKVHWLVGSEEDAPYKTTTWYRCMGVEDFAKRVEEEEQIVGIVFSGNNIGFILKDK